MEGSAMGEGGEKESPPLQIDPKWYVRCAKLLASLTAERTQPSRCSQIILPTHQDRRCARRLLHDVQEGGDRVRCGLRQEV